MSIFKAFTVTWAMLMSLAFSTAFIDSTVLAETLVTPTLQPRTHPEIPWSYENETGPAHWSELDSRFAACSSGQQQSPINLETAQASDLVNPEFHYEPVPLNLLNNGHTVQVPYAPGSYILIEGDRYDLRQFHFHTPSEHAIEGKSQLGELHLVHQNEAGQLAVVAVLLYADDAENNRAYTLISSNLPENAGDKLRTHHRINARSLLPQNTTTYRYSGSLTTPPCSESVTWLVMSDPVPLPSQQLAQYSVRLHHNNRPLQALNNRSVQLDITP